MTLDQLLGIRTDVENRIDMLPYKHDCRTKGAHRRNCSKCEITGITPGRQLAIEYEFLAMVEAKIRELTGGHNVH